MNLLVSLLPVVLISVLAFFMGWILSKQKFLGVEIRETDLSKDDIVFVSYILSAGPSSAIRTYKVYDGSKHGTSQFLPCQRPSRGFRSTSSLKQGCYYRWNGERLIQTTDKDLIAPRSTE